MIESRLEERNNSLSASKTYRSEVNSIRFHDNLLNREQQRHQLDCIKERIWKKHKRVTQRISRQLRELAPPTTFEIYMQKSTTNWAGFN